MGGIALQVVPGVPGGRLVRLIDGLKVTLRLWEGVPRSIPADSWASLTPRRTRLGLSLQDADRMGDVAAVSCDVPNSAIRRIAQQFVTELRLNPDVQQPLLSALSISSVSKNVPAVGGF